MRIATEHRRLGGLAFAATLAALASCVRPVVIADSGDVDDVTIAADATDAPVSRIVVGGAHACALYTDGRVACWGTGVMGQLGVGESVRSAPRPVFVQGLTDAVALGAQLEATCALRRNGRILCWGRADWGSLGDSLAGRVPCGPENSCRFVPTEVEGMTDAVTLYSGENFACARRAGGQVMCWGAVPSVPRSVTTDDGGTSSVNLVEVPWLTDVTSLGGSGFVCALRATGQVTSWGANSMGQLGDGTHTDRSSPVAVLLPPGTTGIGVTAGHACAVQADASVACWGFNGTGQLGTDPASGVDRPTPAPVPGLTDIVEVAAGGDTVGVSCARTRDGHVWCWGAGGLGQLGDGVVHHGTCDGIDCSPTPVMVSGLTDAVQIGAGAGFVCALRSTGGVVCWGNDAQGQLGEGGAGPDCQPSVGHTGTGTDPCVRYTPVDVVGL